jgi:AcrR family transcriptional regulator
MATDTLTRGERTRLAILEAAQELFLENGYQGTSMRQIAERAGGIAVGGIYNHFASKEDIFRQLVEARSPQWDIVAALEEVEGDSGPELLANAWTRLSSIILERVDFAQLMFVDIQEFDGGAMRGVVEKVLPVALSFAQRVIESGGLRTDINPFVMMRALVSLLIGYAMTERVAFSEGQPRVNLIPTLSREEWVEAFVDAYLHGVAGEG